MSCIFKYIKGILNTKYPNISSLYTTIVHYYMANGSRLIITIIVIIIYDID